jgi:membrane-bound lytic murein transglycosylase B
LPVVPVAALGVVIAVMLLLVTAALATQTRHVVVAPQSQLSVVPVSPAAKVLAPSVSGIHASAAWIASTSAATGISPVAVRAYGDASLRLAKDQPSCHLGWTTLAGIGGIESGHGTTGGVTLLADGTTSRPILGPALDGSAGMATIRSDAESTRWHGDAQWDHAVGPMQFIPSTWRTYASDGNEDDKKDPQNMYDATLAAGSYLCRASSGLSADPGLQAAYFSYNHSLAYVANVLGWARGYERIRIPKI